MMFCGGKRSGSSSGQSLIEAALLIPLLVLIVFNAINFGYYFMVALNLSSATRSGTLYSILGGATPAGTSLPPVSASDATVSNLTKADLDGALRGATDTTVTFVRVCSASVSSSAGVSGCQSYGTAPVAFSDPDADPEPDYFTLQRVDVEYQFRPILKGTFFGFGLLALPSCTTSGGNITCTFRRQVSMRAMN